MRREIRTEPGRTESTTGYSAPGRPEQPRSERNSGHTSVNRQIALPKHSRFRKRYTKNNEKEAQKSGKGYLSQGPFSARSKNSFLRIFLRETRFRNHRKTLRTRIRQQTRTPASSGLFGQRLLQISPHLGGFRIDRYDFARTVDQESRSPGIPDSVAGPDTEPVV